MALSILFIFFDVADDSTLVSSVDDEHSVDVTPSTLDLLGATIQGIY